LRASLVRKKWNVIYGTKPEANLKGTAAAVVCPASIVMQYSGPCRSHRYLSGNGGLQFSGADAGKELDARTDLGRQKPVGSMDHHD